MSKANVALVLKTYEAFKTGGFEAMLPFYPPDVVWHPAAGWVEDPVYLGHDGARKMSAIWTDNFDDLVLEPRDVRELEERVLVLAEATGRTKDGAVPISQPYGVLYSDFRDGLIGEARFFFTWEDALASVGLQE